MSIQPAISLRNLTKFYGKQRGIEGLTFDVAPGEAFGFLGPNGAGKTTAIRVLLGLLRPTSGEALVLGAHAWSDYKVRSRVGYLPGSLAVYTSMRVDAYLELMMRMREVDCSVAASRLCERLALDPSRRIHDLSKGNRQKVGVVQAFMHSPDVLILDEPTSGLDPLVQREFEELLREHRNRGAAVLLSSHVLSEVEHLAEQVAIIDRGRLVVVEHIRDLKARAVRTLDLEFSSPVDSQIFAQLPGVSDAESHGVTITCTMTGSEADVLRTALEHGLISVSSHEPSLEDIFLALIDGGEDHAAAAAS
jgi:ABC-2 type transport system ATP-binding protein